MIYLAFFLPMATSRALLLKFSPFDIGTISLLVTLCGVIGALVIWRLALLVHANFLFERPAAFWIAPKKKSAATAKPKRRVASRRETPAPRRRAPARAPVPH